jgi:hypothetical protein
MAQSLSGFYYLGSGEIIKNRFQIFFKLLSPLNTISILYLPVTPLLITQLRWDMLLAPLELISVFSGLPL